MKYILAFLFILVCSGCTPITLIHDPLVPPAEPGKGKILVRQFVDQRDCKNYRIGDVRSNHFIVTGHYETAQKRPLVEVLTPYFADALKTAGYEPLSERATTTAKPDLKLYGTIRKFSIDFNAEGFYDCAMIVRLAASKPCSEEIVWEEDIYVSESANVNALELPWTKINTLLTKGLNEAVQKFASPEFKQLVQRR